MDARTIIGLMSGTSLDGIDVAMLKTDGITITEFGPTSYYSYDDTERVVLRDGLEDAKAINFREERPGRLSAAETIVTQCHERAVRQFMKDNGISARQVDLIGFHGQTVLHRPEQRLTVQIGDGAALAARLGIPVVYDFREKDVASGGQGAPLVPVFHQALVHASGIRKPVAIVNIGGVANITLIDDIGRLSSFDTGPGNALIDDWVSDRTALAYDVDGRLASEGKIDTSILDQLLSHPYFDLKPPKSLDRNAFDTSCMRHLSVIDGAATLTAFTVKTIAKAVEHASFTPSCWILTGGGAQNNQIKRLLNEETGIDVSIAEEFGWSSAFMEAQAFAFLAARVISALPLSFPSTTGVKEPMTGGVVAFP